MIKRKFRLYFLQYGKTHNVKIENRKFISMEAAAIFSHRIASDVCTRAVHNKFYCYICDNLT